ncbi:MAG: SEC-C metal-binding domain-containing protein [Rhabdochlamydiaceae bacterium]
MNKPGRNDPCPCGSGKKFKKCCESKATKKSISSAEVLTGPNKMSSIFNRLVVPPEAKDEP